MSEIKKKRGRPRKNPIIDPIEIEEDEIEVQPSIQIEEDDEEVEKPQRRKSIRKSDTKQDLYMEVTQPADNAGSCRFGFDRRDPDTLCMFIGPLPDIYRIMPITPSKNKQGHATRKAFEDVARRAQTGATAIYAMTKDVRPTTFRSFIALLREELGEPE